jgi:hypothetical protein
MLYATDVKLSIHERKDHYRKEYTQFNDLLTRQEMRDGFKKLNNHLFLDLSDSLSRVEPLGAGASTIHDSVTTVQLKIIVQSFQTLFSCFITRVDDPAIRLHQHSGAEILEGEGSAGKCRGAYEGHEVEQQAQRMHSYRPSSLARFSLV